jgi:hypothetical protein
MREIGTELKTLKLYGMASAWGELSASDNDVGIQSSRWLIERLLEAETTDRAMRSIWQASISSNRAWIESSSLSSRT